MNKTTINDIDVSECNIRFYHFGKNICELGNRKLGELHYLCSENPNCYFKQLKQLQKENEELKKQLEFSRTHKTVLDAERIKYKQTLKKIKGWATNHNPCDIEAGINCTKEDCFECLNYDIKKITTIINEVLNDK